MTRLGNWWKHSFQAALLAAIGFMLVLLILPATKPIRDGFNLNMNNLHQIGLAFHTYHDVHKILPLAAIDDKEGKPLLSWRVALLPYLEEAQLYSQFHLDEPWDSPHNLTLLARIPHVYKPPTGQLPDDTFGTYYQALVGPCAAFENKIPMTFKSFPNGTSQTILVIEAGDAVPWTKPEDLQFNPDQPLPNLSGHSRKGVIYSLFADGSVHALPNSTDEETLHALITRNGGEKLESDKNGWWHILPKRE